MSDHPVKVLLVEDNEGDVRLMREWLAESREISFEVVWANTLAKGMKALGENPIDVVLLDLSLPDSHGQDTYFELQEKCPTAPVIILSGQDDERMAVKTVQDGAQDYLVKSYLVTGHLLVRAIRYAIERKRMTIELSQRMRELREALKQARKSEWEEPLCARCEPMQGDAQFWRGLEKYLEEHALAATNSGFCSRCYEQILKSKLDDFRFNRFQSLYRQK